MPAAGEAVVNQPGEKSLSCRFVTVSKVLADSTLPGPKGLHTSFDESAVPSFVTCTARSALILAERQSREAETNRRVERSMWLSRTKEFDRLFYGAPALLGYERLRVARRLVLFTIKERL